MKRFLMFTAPFCLCVILASCTTEKREAREAKTSEAVPPASQEGPTIPIDEMPKLLTSSVTYPEEARARGEQGIVVVKARIGTDGRVIKVLAQPDSNASPTLEKAALESVKSWTFTPAKSNGEPVETWVMVPVRFKLK